MASKEKSSSGELQLIESIRARAMGQRSAALRLGIGDDCAVVRPPAGHDLLVTTDFSLEGRHFRRDWHSATSAGHRCLARGLSDLAAMGAKPLAAFLSLGLPAGMTRKAAGRQWVDGFMDGLLAPTAETGTPLAGGDTATAPGEAVLADIVLLGSAPRGTELRRRGARAGDGIYVTGALGGAAAELAMLAESSRRFRSAKPDKAPNGTHPHLFPQPRLATGWRLRGAKIASAAIDVSDGLSTDLAHLCRESGVGAVVDSSALPLHSLLVALPADEALRLALHGGEDYELLFTARPSTRVPRRIAGVSVTRIGTVSTGSSIMLRDRDGRETPLQPGGWEHDL